jgi:SAM-dependent methyltransferase
MDLVSARTATREHYETYPFVEGGEPRIRHWIRRLQPLLPDDLLLGRTVLDIGCGSGEASLGLLERGAVPVSLDLTWSAVRRLKQRRPRLPVLQGDALHLPFRSASFDHAVSIGVLHHTPDWRRGIAEAARVVKPGGRLVLMLYAARTPYHLAWRCAGPLRSRFPVRALGRVPRWLLAVMRTMVVAQGRQRFPDDQLRRLLADQFWTPVASFISRTEMDAAAARAGLRPVAHVPLFWHAHLVAYERSGS